MSAPPIRRIAGAIGLAALAPTAYLLAIGSLSPSDAAFRAVMTLGAVELVGRVADRSLSRLADVLERSAEPADEEAMDRRADDAVATD